MTGSVPSVVLSYAHGLVRVCEGALHDWARRRIPWLAAAVLIVMLIAFKMTLEVGTLARQNLLARPWGLVFAATGIVALIGVFLGTRTKRDGLPFAMTALFFLSAFLTLGVMFWP